VAFCGLVLALKAQRLVFIDESFVKTGMRREYGWGPRGTRVVGTRPNRNWKTVSVIGAIRLGHKPRVMTHRGTVTGRVYLRFLRQRLVPWLRPGDVVVMDNLNIHKSKAVRDAIAAAGAEAVYLPTYSPELNPIELLWAEIKRDLRRLAINEEPELRAAVRRLRRRVPMTKVAGWFGHALTQARIN
jgi:transposase